MEDFILKLIEFIIYFLIGVFFAFKVVEKMHRRNRHELLTDHDIDENRKDLYWSRLK